MSKQIALVTGGTRGIGLEVCRQLGKKNIHVILTGRNQELGKKDVEKLLKENISVEFFPLDVTSQEEVDQCYEMIKRKFGRLDILVNNAGIAIDIDIEKAEDREDEEKGSFLNAKIDKIQKTMDTNTYGPIRLIKKFIPLMKENGFGRIVNVSSQMGQLEEMDGGWTAYRLSKVGLNAVTRIVASEVDGKDILVNSVCPGWVRTDMGGEKATLSVEEGADTIVWLAMLPTGGPTGGFFKNRKQIAW